MLAGEKVASQDEQMNLIHHDDEEISPSNSKRQKFTNTSFTQKGTPLRSKATENWLISWDTPSMETMGMTKETSQANVLSPKDYLLDSSDVYVPLVEPKYTKQERERIKKTFEEQVGQELEYLRAELAEATRVREDFEDRMIETTEEAESIKEKILEITEGPQEGSNSDLETDEALEYEIEILERELKLRDQEAELWDQEILRYTDEEKKLTVMVEAEAEERQSLEFEMSDKKERYEADLTIAIMEMDVLKESLQDTQKETDHIRKVFSQLKERYDKLKKVYESTRKNEENLANMIRRLQQDVHTSEERVSILKNYRNERAEEADMHIAEERSKYQSDIMDYKAQLQATLEEAIQMKDGFDNMITQLSLINENADDDIDMSKSYLP